MFELMIRLKKSCRLMSTLVYDSQSGQYINTKVQGVIYDFTLNMNEACKDINHINHINHISQKINNRNGHTTLFPSIDYLKGMKVHEYNSQISIKTKNMNNLNEIISWNTDNKVSVQAHFEINIDDDTNEWEKNIKRMIIKANENNIITTSILNTILDSSLDLNRINNYIANLADMNSSFIILSLQTIEDDDLIREIVENAFNIDCVGNPINTRLGLFFKELNCLEVAQNTKILHFGIHVDFPELIEKLLK